jgi:hypothetical protein
MSELKKHAGGCHCGNVRYEVMMDLSHAMECNCSMCSKKAPLMAFVPKDQFTLLKGEEQLSDYQFNKHVIHHLFCRNCGIHSFGRGTGPDGKEMRMVNVRCLDDIDISALEIKHFDGKSK